MCISNTSFVNNTLDQESSQRYIMKIFGEAIAWRANKQDTLTTLSTKLELLVISQLRKEVIYLFYLIKALKLFLLEILTIKCNKKQTIQLWVTNLQICKPSYGISTYIPIG